MTGEIFPDFYFSHNYIFRMEPRNSSCKNNLHDLKKYVEELYPGRCVIT